MQTWVITRTSTGYGELESVVVRAESIDAARLLIVRENRHLNGITDFLMEEYTTAVLVTENAAGIVSQSFSAS